LDLLSTRGGLTTHTVGVDKVPVNLLASDGKSTTKGLAGGLAHNVVASIKSLVEVVLNGGKSLHDSGSAGSDIARGLDGGSLDGIGVELHVTILIVVNLKTDATLNLDTASLGGDGPDRTPATIPEVAWVEESGGDANVELAVLCVNTECAERIVIVHILSDGLLQSSTHGLEAAINIAATDGTSGSDDLLDVIEGSNNTASMIDVLVGAEFSILSDEETMGLILRISLDHLILVVPLEGSGGSGVQHGFLGKKSANICDNLHELTRGSVEKEVVCNGNKLLLRSHRVVYLTKKKTSK